ncbi:toxin-antitoxin system HicB family antitoxin [Bradyrhizobium sp. CCBAU 53415]|uniref:toxin-antitoxin system HicB family antitoxin n=1 Tax=Bradyrhizobium sp. CCBAU 53415 TaxID=1325119 RepID=UPI0023057679|nr:toxin-antitoxin system HicB family antitoxin [Bradyrhizobium sp. CCBAU 53415]
MGARSEALNEIGPAIEAWISAAEAAGNPVPPPAALDDELPSGKFLVRVAKTVHAQLSAAAQREGISLNQYVGTILATATLGNIYSRATSGLQTPTLPLVMKPLVSNHHLTMTYFTNYAEQNRVITSGLKTMQVAGAIARSMQAPAHAEQFVIRTFTGKPVSKSGARKKAAVHG